MTKVIISRKQAIEGLAKCFAVLNRTHMRRLDRYIQAGKEFLCGMYADEYMWEGQA